MSEDLEENLYQQNEIIHEGFELRIKTYVRKCDFDIHPAMMDAGLGHYGDVILALLNEGYGFKSRNENHKWHVEKYRSNIKLDEQTKELEEALILIFKLLKYFKKKITEE